MVPIRVASTKRSVKSSTSRLRGRAAHEYRAREDFGHLPAAHRRRRQRNPVGYRARMIGKDYLDVVSLVVQRHAAEEIGLAVQQAAGGAERKAGALRQFRCLR